MYLPPQAITLDKAKPGVFSLGIQGYGGTGKTWAALTFPKPIIVNCDRALGAHYGRSDVHEIRMFGPEYAGGKLKDAVHDFLTKEAKHLEADQTLIIDGQTTLESSYHAWWRRNPVITKKTGAIDEFSEWALKEIFFDEICDLMNNLNCNVIYIAHETPRTMKDGTSKIRPLMTGKVGDKIVNKFSDWVRQFSMEKPKEAPTTDKLALWGMKTKEEWQAMCNTFPRNTIYFWKLDSDDFFDGKISSLINYPCFIPANWQNFSKYMRFPSGNKNEIPKTK